MPYVLADCRTFEKPILQLAYINGDFSQKKSTTGAFLDVYNTWAMEIDKENEVAMCHLF